MTVDDISINQSNKTEKSLTNKSSNWNGRVVADIAHQNKQNLKAGAGPEMLNELGRVLFTIGIIFTAAVAALSVGIATRSLSSALITGGVICVGAFIFASFVSNES